ncbi:MAG: serine/threonine protein kinase [Planctomycetes bacterium]|nr:serine/threonine protein kinase [Planctomycetota bacterium]
MDPHEVLRAAVARGWLDEPTAAALAPAPPPELVARLARALADASAPTLPPEGAPAPAAATLPPGGAVTRTSAPGGAAPTLPPGGAVTRTSAGASAPGVAGGGQRFGPYDVERELGRGGMGVVYVARHRALGRRVALKVLPALVTESRVQRFLTEAQAAARLRHDHVVTVHEAGQDDAGRHWIAMDLVEGESLAARLLRGGPLEPREAARIARALAAGVAHAHAMGVLHRDLKPDNVLLRPDGAPLVVDFGLAKDARRAEALTRTGDVLGTPGYLAPEQADGRSGEADARTDVYGLGATLFHMLAGAPPFQGSVAVAVLARVIRDAAPAPSTLAPGVPPALDAICARCLAKDPADRYPTAAALGEDLDRFLRGEAPAGAPRRPRGRAVVVAALVGLLALAAGWGWRARQRLERLVTRAEAHARWEAEVLEPWALGVAPGATLPATRTDLAAREADLEALLRDLEAFRFTSRRTADRTLAHVRAAARRLALDAGEEVALTDGAADRHALVVDALVLRAKGDLDGAGRVARAALASHRDLPAARGLELLLLLDADPAALLARAAREPDLARPFVAPAAAALTRRAPAATTDDARRALRGALGRLREVASACGVEPAEVARARAAALEADAPAWAALLLDAVADGREAEALGWLVDVVAAEPRARVGPALARAVEDARGALLDACAAARAAGRPAREWLRAAPFDHRAWYDLELDLPPDPRLPPLLRAAVVDGLVGRDAAPELVLCCLRRWEDHPSTSETMSAFHGMYDGAAVDALLASHERSRARALRAWLVLGPPTADNLRAWLDAAEAALVRDGLREDLSPFFRWAALKPGPLIALARVDTSPPLPVVAARAARLGRAGVEGLTTWADAPRDAYWLLRLLAYLGIEAWGQAHAEGAVPRALAPEWAAGVAAARARRERVAAGEVPGDPDDEAVLLPMLLHGQARELVDLGRVDEALPLLDEALALLEAARAQSPDARGTRERLIVEAVCDRARGLRLARRAAEALPWLRELSEARHLARAVGFWEEWVRCAVSADALAEAREVLADAKRRFARDARALQALEGVERAVRTASLREGGLRVRPRLPRVSEEEEGGEGE